MVPRFIPVVELQYVPILKVVEDSDLFKKKQRNKLDMLILNKDGLKEMAETVKLTSFKTFRLRNFSTDLTATYSTVFFLRP